MVSLPLPLPPWPLRPFSPAGSLSVSLDDSLLRSLASLSRPSFLFLSGVERVALELRDREMTIYKLLPGILLPIQNASLDARLVHYAELIHGCDRPRATCKRMPRRCFASERARYLSPPTYERIDPADDISRKNNVRGTLPLTFEPSATRRDHGAVTASVRG